MAQEQTKNQSTKLIDNPVAVKLVTKKVEFFVNIAKKQKDKFELLILFYNLCPTGDEKKLFIAMLEVKHPEYQELAEYFKKNLYDIVEVTVSKKRPDGTRTQITKHMGNGLPKITEVETIKDDQTFWGSTISSSSSSAQKQGLLSKIIKGVAKGIRKGLNSLKTKGASVSKVSAEELMANQPQKVEQSKLKTQELS